MHTKRLASLALIAALTFSISCNRFMKPDDGAISTDIKAKMFSDASLKSSNVDVSTHDGVVTLSGQVTDDSARLAAFKIATETKGVTRVNDQMIVAPLQAAVTPPTTPSDPASVTPPVANPTPKPSAPAVSKPKKVAPPSTASPDSPASTPTPAPNSTPAAQVAPPAPPPPQPVTVTIPANTIISVRTIDSVDSTTNRTGQTFRGSLDAPITDGDKVIIPTGADCTLKLVNASSAGRMAGRSELTLDISSIMFQGKSYSVATSDVKQSGASRGKRTAATIGGGAALGALIGAIAGGGKGAAIGAAVGGGAGTGVQVFTKGQQVKIPSETRLDFTLEQPFDITYFPGKKSPRKHADSQPTSVDQIPDASSDRPPQQ